MVWKRAVMATLAVLAMVVGTQAVRAGDVTKLGLNTSAPTLSLDLKPGENADVQETWWRRGYYSGYYGYGYYRPSFYYGYSYYRPSFYYGYSSYYPYYYRPSYYYTPSYYYSPYYYIPSYYYSPYYCPISLKVTAGSSAVVPGGAYQPAQPALPKMDPLPPTPAQPSQPAQPSDGTFPYDGGPSNPVPMPKGDTVPQGTPNKGFVPGEGRLVSLPVLPPVTQKYTYPAYGDNKLPPRK
jgi:hypothetical protein